MKRCLVLYTLLMAAFSLQAQTPNWLMNARQEIRDREYIIKWKTNLNKYVAVNRRNSMGFLFNEEGYRVISFTPGTDHVNNWTIDFSLQHIQRGAQILTTVSTVETIHSGSALNFLHKGFTMEYLNDSNGMRQNFIVNEKLPGTGPLEIRIGMDGDLKSSVENGRSLSLSKKINDQYKTVLVYDDLKVWDRNNQSLNSFIELSEDGKSFVIKVDDSNAVYPITVDPLNHAYAWTDNGLGVIAALDVLYGSTVSDAGDVNNDGFDDIIIGAPANIDVLSNSVVASIGQAFIYLGSAGGLSTTPSITLQSSTAVNALFGYSVSSAGDINNDGFDDVIVGAPGDQVTINFGFPLFNLTNNIGKVYVYYGNAVPASMPGSVLALNLTASDFTGATFAITTNPQFGFSVSGAGDVNNDGFDDVIVGSPTYTDLGTLTLGGRATIYLGSAGGLQTGSPIHRNGGLLVNALFGYSVSSAGDMNNDGKDEVLIGAPGALSLLPGLTGKAYVYQGTATGIAASAVTYSSNALFKTLFGFSVSNAGDVNNDGFGDIVVGEPGTLSLSGLITVGSARVFFGEATLSNKSSADITLRSHRDPDIFGLLEGNLLMGFSVSGGRDLNCDGISDIVVGEPGGTAITGLPGLNAAGGRAYIYYGNNGTGPVTQPGWELKETGSLVVANLLGYSVSTAGDVNGDGKPEFLVGAANGTLDLSNLLSGLLNFLFVQSVGSAYVYNGCITPTLFTLPVTLISFNAYLQGSAVAVKWKVTAEDQIAHYEVERSADGIHYNTIGQRNAAGNNSAVTDYLFNDMNPVTGSNYYRLKIVEQDGSYKYSQVVLVKTAAIASIKARSGFAGSSVDIDFNKVVHGNYMISLFGMDGKLVQQNNTEIREENSTKTIQLNKLPKGIYILKVQKAGDKHIYTDKIFIY